MNAWPRQQRQFEAWLWKLNPDLILKSATCYVKIYLPTADGEDDEWVTIRFSDHPPAVGGGYDPNLYGGLGGRHGDAAVSVHPGGNTLPEAKRFVRERLAPKPTR